MAADATTWVELVCRASLEHAGARLFPRDVGDRLRTFKRSFHRPPAKGIREMHFRTAGRSWL